MKRIMFNDRYDLTMLVIMGLKTMTRRACTLTLTDAKTMEDVEIEDIYQKDGVWMFKLGNKSYELPRQNYPAYQVGDIVAVQQAYEDLHMIPPSRMRECFESKGFKNKLYVKAKYMPYGVKITHVKAERLQNISDEDCIKEGVKENQIGYFIRGLRSTKDEESYTIRDGIAYKLFPNPRKAFATLMDKISGRGTWDENKWHWVFELDLVKR